VQPGDLHRQRLLAQPVAAAGAAGAVVLVALEFLADPVRIGLAVAPFHVGDHPLEGAGDLVDPPALVEAEAYLLLAGAVEKYLLHMGGQVFPRRVAVKLVVLCNGLDGLAEIGRLALAPGGERAVIDVERDIGHHEALVEEQLYPQPVAGRAGPEGRVEREQSRFDLGDGEPAHRAGEFFREGEALGFAVLRLRRGLQHRDAVGKIERGAQTVGQPRLQPFAHDDPVHHHVDIVAEVLLQLRRVFELVETAIDLDPLEALLAQLGEFLAILALAVADDRGEQVGARALRHRHHPVDHVLHLLGLDRQPGGGGIGRAGAGEQKAQVVVDFRDRAHGGARVLARGALLDGDRGAEAGDVIDIGLLHHVEKLPGIGRERFDVAALALCIDRVEGQRGFARARKPGDHHQFIARDIHVDALEIMLARTAHLDELLLGHGPPRLTRP